MVTAIYDGDRRPDIEDLDPGVDELSRHLLYDFYCQEGIIQLAEDGALLGIIEYEARDIDSQDPDEFAATKHALANILFQFKGGFTFHFITDKRRTRCYPQTVGANPMADLIDAERREMLTQPGRQYRVRHFIAVAYHVTDVRMGRVAGLFVDKPVDRPVDTYRDHILPFAELLSLTAAMVGNAVGRAVVLNTPQVQAALATMLDVEEHGHVQVPDLPFWPLKTNLMTKGVVPGAYMQFSNGTPNTTWDLRVLGINGYPASSVPGLMRGILDIDCEGRWILRAEMMDPDVAARVFQAIYKKYEDTSYDTRSVIGRTFGGALKRDAVGVIEALQAEQAKVEAAGKSSGHMTPTFVTWAPAYLPDGTRSTEIDDNVKKVKEVFRGAGCLVIEEGWTAEHSFLGTLPGHRRPGVRRVPLAQTVMADWPVLSTPWPGAEMSAARPGGPLMVLESSGGFPLRLDPWDGKEVSADNDAALVMTGKPRSGKSTAQATIGSQLLARLGKSRVVWLDVDTSDSTSMVATLAHGGAYLRFGGGADRDIALQPFADVDTAEGFSWGMRFAMDLLTLKGAVGEGAGRIPPGEAETIVTRALKDMVEGLAEERNMVVFHDLLQKKELRRAVGSFRRGEADGDLLDCDQDHLASADWVTVDVGKLIERKEIGMLAMRALLRRLYRLFEDGRPTLLMVGEAYRMIRECPAELEDMRRRGPKKNVTLFLETHQLTDLAGGSLGGMLRTIPTKLAMHDPQATKGGHYREMDFNWTEAEQVTKAPPPIGRHVFCKTVSGSRQGVLALGPLARAVCGCGAKDREDALAIHARVGTAGFGPAWLRHKGLRREAQKLETMIRRMEVSDAQAAE